MHDTPPPPQLKLRPYQTAALDASKRDFLAGVRRQVVVLPTGTGKAVVLAVLKRHHGIEGKVLVLVHREELAEQAADKFRRWAPGCRIGIEMGDRRCSPSDDVVVASVQTIGRAGSSRLAQFNPSEFGLVIVDEVHLGVTKSYERVYSHFGLTGEECAKDKLLVGFTATPNRTDGHGLIQFYDKIVYEMGIREAVEEGWLSPPCGLKVTTNVNLTDIKTRMGDFALDELTNAVNTEARNDLVARTWLERAAERSTIVFTVDIAHAKKMAEAFQRYGVPAQPIWGDDPDRKEKLKQHRAGTIKVLCNCALLTTGYDDPSVSCIVMARPTKSALLFCQSIGRGSRLQEGISNLKDAIAAGIPLTKRDFLVIDVADTVGRHSLITLPTLFGIGDKTDLAGRSVVEAVAEIEKARLSHPAIDFTKLDDIRKLDSFVQEASLFKADYAPEVLRHSTMQWAKIGPDKYILLLPNKESVYIKKNFLSKWSVAGKVNGQKFTEIDITSLEMAFSFSEKMIAVYGQNIVSFIRRNNKWKADPATEKQVALMKKFGVVGADSMSKGEATKIIVTRLKHRMKYPPNKINYPAHYNKHRANVVR